MPFLHSLLFFFCFHGPLSAQPFQHKERKRNHELVRISSDKLPTIDSFRNPQAFKDAILATNGRVELSPREFGQFNAAFLRLNELRVDADYHLRARFDRPIIPETPHGPFYFFNGEDFFFEAIISREQQ